MLKYGHYCDLFFKMDFFQCNNMAKLKWIMLVGYFFLDYKIHNL